MSSTNSVTHWIELLRQGDHAAARPLWERYYQQLVRLARSRLGGRPRRVADEEDVALSAFASFCRGIERGRFPLLTDRQDLWALLVVITARKVLDLSAQQRRVKRGRGKVRGDSAFEPLEDGECRRGIEDVIGREPTPDFAAQVAEEYERLLDLLGDDGLRQIAVWRMEGFTNEEIKDRLDCSRVTVERKLRRIRQTWEQENAAPGEG
jgi:RNA polymerase sigma factor (sigma-70 family)